MGVRGLTKYIYENEDFFFKKYSLKNSYLIVDGNCLASVLFHHSVSSSSAFGGDYDKYAYVIEAFFKQLILCQVTPIVIFDGAYEKRKLKTVCSRLRNKVISLEKVSPFNIHTQCYPLMMRQVFRDKLKQMNISYSQSDLEADREIAALARKLNCPVLSSDSDFFIFDIKYIPLNNFPVTATKSDDGADFYIPCKIYIVDHFLQRLGGLPKTLLPLLAVLLGNDYISRHEFSNFYSQMKLVKGHKIKHTTARVKSIIKWLKHETFETALNKILGHIKKYRKTSVAFKVANIIEGYTSISSPLDAYLFEETVKKEEIEILNIKNILDKYDDIKYDSDVKESIDDKSSDEEETSSLSGTTYTDDSSEHSESKEDKLDISNFLSLQCKTIQFPSWLIDHSRKGLLPSYFLTLISLKTYFCNPQIEDYQFKHSGDICVSIVSKIAGLVLGRSKYYYYARKHRSYSFVTLNTIVSSKNFIEFPSISSLDKLTLNDRQLLMVDIFNVSPKIFDFPKHWHIFLISLMLWVENMKEPPFQISYLHGIILMLIGVYIIELKIGYFRKKRQFMQRFASRIKFLSLYKPPSVREDLSFDDIIQKIPIEECLIAFEILLPYFHVDEPHRTNPKLFSREVIHGFAQFQVCLDLAISLNSLLLFPFSHCYIHQFYNATFLYNITCNFKKRSNIMAYISTILVKCPTILLLYKKLFNTLKDMLNIHCPLIKMKKRKKKKKGSRSVYQLCDQEKSNSESSEFSDEDNKYSLLANLKN